MTPFADSTLVIFTRAPVLGTVKTRLARSIGDAAALALHKSCLARAVALAAGEPRWAGCLAVAPDTAVAGPDGESPTWAGGLPVFPQGEGDLGARMMRVLTRATPTAPVVLMGSDIPAATPEHISRAFASLRDAKLAFGPSEDGGFWLVGASAPPSPDLFSDIRWSSVHALSDVTVRLARDAWRAVDTLWDVDEPDDLSRYLAMAELSTVIDDFRAPPMASVGTEWKLVADSVMGGRSTGSMTRETLGGRPVLRLRGTVSLENNGGFVQAALDLAPDGTTVDAAGFQGIEIDVAGNGEFYGLHLRTADVTRPWQSYRQGFVATDLLRTVRLPFDGFETHRIDLPLDLTRLRRIGLVAIGRAFEADLSIAGIRFYR